MLIYFYLTPCTRHVHEPFVGVMLVTPAFKRQTKASPGYVVRLCLKNINKNTKNKFMNYLGRATQIRFHPKPHLSRL